MRFVKQVRAVALVCGLTVAGAARLEGGPAADHDHAHPTEGPHHGALIELGREDYHAELVHDETTDTVTIHVLDATATKPVPIGAKQLVLNLRAAGRPQQFPLAATPQDGDPEGSASAFAATSPELCRALDVEGASGRLNVEIEGRVYVGKVGGHAHAHRH